MHRRGALKQEPPGDLVSIVKYSDEGDRDLVLRRVEDAGLAARQLLRLVGPTAVHSESRELRALLSLADDVHVREAVLNCNPLSACDVDVS
jgi:hypothetical protein